ncbi:diguanylate cyclase [Rhizobium sp. Root274]|uniref:putative bifunctional diguanylate cyclase/phosphodiesterase n=1 Tax=unclassified Rhizobium TaxID=2613769 RepID=UPI0007127193|nr:MULTISPECIES: EAL domain-containing protein [unclassified Rhizobium]KQW26391.1 diguanylate cyclase [Rhizobium sp. Root1240]KRD26428.1 diguanylate cyclase [Rhizobium sp. Root274]
MFRYVQNKGFFVFGLPLMLTVVTVILLLGALFLAATKADEAAAKRQERLLKLVVSNLAISVAHDQESATVWDDAVEYTKRRDMEWMASNLGEWMHTYFEHDAALVLASDEQIIYSFVAHPEASADAPAIVAAAAPLIRRLKPRLEAGETSDSSTILSIGQSDLLNIAGRAAVVSVKPIISDTGDIAQVPGSENLHISIRYLDGTLLQRLSQDYLFRNLVFVRSATLGTKTATVPLRSKSGAAIGFFEWEPFSPGSSVIQAVLPIIVVIGLSAFSLMACVGHAYWRRSCSLVASQNRLKHLAMHDPLTGLANRATFNHSLEQRLEASAISNHNVAVLFVDLDHFKAVNDTYGHPTGDALIQEVAHRLLKVAPAALISRLGGDEFTLLLDVGELNDPARIAEEIVANLRQPYHLNGNYISIGASVGVSISTPGAEAVDLTRRADIALYHAKAAGRNTFAVFGAHMEELLHRRRALTADLATALESHTQLAVHYQPVYAATDNRVVSFEALCRWQHPAMGAISPEVFIPIAEEAGLIEKLGMFVLEDACSLLATLPSPDLTMAVNASAIELMAPGYPLRVLTRLAAYGIAPDRLEIEITERVAADAEGRAATAISLLRKAGVRFAIDDFGKGSSSFGHLLNLDVDRIKIDKMFVDGMNDGGGLPLVQAIVQMAQHKGLRTTAEGIETPEQCETLKQLGCDHLQGFQLGKPRSKQQVIQLLSDRSLSVSD